MYLYCMKLHVWKCDYLKYGYIHTKISEGKNPSPRLYFFREFNHYYTVTNMLPLWHDILIIFLSWLFFQIGYIRSAYGRPNKTIFEKKVNLKKWSKYHAEVATYQLQCSSDWTHGKSTARKGDSCLQKFLCEYTKVSNHDKV